MCGRLEPSSQYPPRGLPPGKCTCPEEVVRCLCIWKLRRGGEGKPVGDLPIREYCGGGPAWEGARKGNRKALQGLKHSLERHRIHVTQLSSGVEVSYLVSNGFHWNLLPRNLDLQATQQDLLSLLRLIKPIWRKRGHGLPLHPLSI